MALQACYVCGHEQEETTMYFKYDKYFDTAECLNAYYQTANVESAFSAFAATINGFTGKSAYQSWINLGNTGTEQDFIDSLQGEAGELTPEQLTYIISQVDVSNKVDKVTGSSLVPDTEIAKIHAPGSDNQDLSEFVVKETGKSLVQDTEIAKIHDNTLDHAAHSDDQDLSGKADVGHTHTGTYEPADINIQTHVIAAHAPSNAQKNSDITKAEIEAKLTGEIATHTHAGGSGNIGEFCINVQALTSSPSDGQTVYFGMLPKAPTTTANISKIYLRHDCTLKRAEIYCYSGTAGTNETWSLYIRKNNTTDTLIKTNNINTNERVFSNTNLNVSFIGGDYLEMKSVHPTWATNPATTIWGGYLYFE